MSLKTLSKSLDLLDCFTTESPVWGVRELAKKLDMHHTVVHRIITTFEAHGFLIQNKDTSKYHLGLKLLDYSNVVTSQLNIQDYVRPLIKEICEATNESVYLTMPDGKEGVCVSVELSMKEVKHITPIGSRAPLYAGASNKVIMAFLGMDLQEQMIQEGLQSVTKHTITDPELLRKQLKTIRLTGWCVSVGELTDEVIGISVPIISLQGRVMASVTVAGPNYRFPEEKIQHCLEVLLARLPYLKQSFNIISHIW